MILPATPDAIERAARLLRDGDVVAFPTETVYGLGGDATNERAVARIFAVKGRPHFNPLIVHVAGLPEAAEFAIFDDRARRVAQRFWPGPLSLVLPRRPGCGISLLASAGLDTIALRAPAHPTAQALLHACGRPLAAPSANRSGRVSPTTAPHVAADFGGDLTLVLDAGPCRVGLESTVLDLSDATPALLRAGGVTLEELAEVLGRIDALAIGEAAPRSPGRLASHYAPSLPVRPNVTSARTGEALLAFGLDAPPGFAEVLFLSRTGDLGEAAANLFSMLRRLDRPKFTAIAVMPIPEDGLGRAINDRLRRAAALRPPSATPANRTETPS